VGLQLLREDGRVFACYTAMADTIYHAEVPCLHPAGFTLGLGMRGCSACKRSP
jgi:hypothetical protein